MFWTSLNAHLTISLILFNSISLIEEFTLIQLQLSLKDHCQKAFSDITAQSGDQLTINLSLIVTHWNANQPIFLALLIITLLADMFANDCCHIHSLSSINEIFMSLKVGRLLESWNAHDQI